MIMCFNDYDQLCPNYAFLNFIKSIYAYYKTPNFFGESKNPKKIHKFLYLL